MGKKGFTLIELVMVIVFLAILGAVAIPVFVNLRGESEEGFVKQLTGSLKEAYTNYMLRLAIENVPETIPSFTYFVGLTENASERNTIKINQSIRNLLVNPNGDVMTNNTTLTFVFKNGGTVIYTLNPAAQQITELYTP